MFRAPDIVCFLERLAQDVKINVCRERPMSVSPNTSLVLLRSLRATEMVCVVQNISLVARVRYWVPDMVCFPSNLAKAALLKGGSDL